MLVQEKCGAYTPVYAGEGEQDKQKQVTAEYLVEICMPREKTLDKIPREKYRE